LLNLIGEELHDQIALRKQRLDIRSPDVRLELLIERCLIHPPQVDQKLAVAAQEIFRIPQRSMRSERPAKIDHPEMPVLRD
jgi:hypothetical protein